MFVDDKGIKDLWKEYMEKLMNEENEWDHKISAEVKEGLTDCIRMAEVRAVLTTTIYRLFSRTIWVSRYQKGKTNLVFTGARDSEWQWHQLSHMQVCTSLQTDSHATASNPPLSFLQAGCPSCRQTNSVKALKECSDK